MKQRDRSPVLRGMPARAYLVFALSLVACDPERQVGHSPPPLTDDPWDGGEVSIIGSSSDEGDDDSVALADASAPDVVEEVDAADAADDVTVDGACTTPLVAGDLAIVELMIASVAGAGDYGEWVEVTSNETCARNLRGLHGDIPVGAKVHTFDIASDMWIPPGGTFLIADSDAVATNHDLPGPIVVWSGAPGDVLRNMGATISLRTDDALIESLTYPALKLTTGASVAFPSACPADERASWAHWQISTASWFPGFTGTPNAPNDDVPCRLGAP